MIIFSEASEQLPPSASRVDILRSTEAARLQGLKVYSIPPDFAVAETAENAIWHVPDQDQKQVGFWIGYIPDPDRYEALYKAALAKNVQLINSPNEHLRAMEFHRFYPLIESFTPRSIILTSADDVPRIDDELGYPVFIKGTIQSRKHDGWSVCVAENRDEAVERISDLLKREVRSRGSVIVRELVRLKHIRRVGNEFPAGREFRAFVLQGEIIQLAYYWDDPDELSMLSQSEKQTVTALITEVASRVAVPYMTVDIGQLENDNWIVVEIGDAQFAGLSQASPLQLWNRVAELITPQ